MNHFPETYIVLLNYGGPLGRAFAETEPGDTFSNAVHAIFTGQFGGKDTRVVGVYRVGLGLETIDMSDAVCQVIAARCLGGERASEMAIKFLDYCDHPDYLAITEPAE